MTIQEFEGLQVGDVVEFSGNQFEISHCMHHPVTGATWQINGSYDIVGYDIKSHDSIQVPMLKLITKRA